MPGAAQRDHLPVGRAGQRDSLGVRAHAVTIAVQHEGRAADAPATLVVDGRELPATCINLGRSGARVRVERTLAAGCGAVLRLPGLPELPGHVLDGGEEVSLHFGWEPDAAPVALRERLGQPAAA